ncbi:hypothetical protein EON65_32115 [archaeon]|nr:MAG: hypothetical protein EON65_32115 [archaeon]
MPFVTHEIMMYVCMYLLQVFQSKAGLYCDIEGVVCGRQGICIENGCVCDSTFAGNNCEEPLGPMVPGASRGWVQDWGEVVVTYLLWVVG